MRMRTSHTHLCSFDRHRVLVFCIGTYLLGGCSLGPIIRATPRSPSRFELEQELNVLLQPAPGDHSVVFDDSLCRSSGGIDGYDPYLTYLRVGSVNDVDQFDRDIFANILLRNHWIQSSNTANKFVKILDASLNLNGYIILPSEPANFDEFIMFASGWGCGDLVAD
jgi:hypothetical protein